MSKETYVIAKDGEGEELEVVKAICVKCSAYEFVSLDKAKEINDENFKCTVCNTTKLVKRYVKCAACGQTMDPISMKCFCPEENKPLLTWYDKSKKNPVAKKLEEEIEDGKIRTLERKIVITAKQEEHERKVRMDVNLDKNNIILQMIHNIPDEQIEEFKKTQEELKKTKKELEDV